MPLPIKYKGLPKPFQQTIISAQLEQHPHIKESLKVINVAIQALQTAAQIELRQTTSPHEHSLAGCIVAYNMNHRHVAQLTLQQYIRAAATQDSAQLATELWIHTYLEIKLADKARVDILNVALKHELKPTIVTTLTKATEAIDYFVSLLALVGKGTAQSVPALYYYLDVFQAPRTQTYENILMLTWPLLPFDLPCPKRQRLYFDRLQGAPKAKLQLILLNKGIEALCDTIYYNWNGIDEYLQPMSDCFKVCAQIYNIDITTLTTYFRQIDDDSLHITATELLVRTYIDVCLVPNATLRADLKAQLTVTIRNLAIKRKTADARTLGQLYTEDLPNNVKQLHIAMDPKEQSGTLRTIYYLLDLFQPSQRSQAFKHLILHMF
tara:strand:+ start:2439 stop:3578 length:1140 start_codon:yes stop_codon:yes gene_type:complete